MDTENIRKLVVKAHQLVELSADLVTQRPKDAQMSLDVAKRLLLDAYIFLTPEQAPPVVEVKAEEVP